MGSDRRSGPPRPPSSSARLAALAVTCLASAAVLAQAAPPTVEEAGAARSPRPNLLVVETDDQTVQSLRVMDSVQSLLADRGATFSNSFVNFPLCCPSRATFLTGQYAHNHGVRDNRGPNGGFHAFESRHAHNNLAVWLHRAGYHTGLIGKYLNGYAVVAPHKPPGWSEFQAAIGGPQYDYDMAENGSLVHYGTAVSDYKEDVLSSKAVNFVNREAPRARPFFLWLTYGAPHVAGPDPSPQPAGDCDDAAKPAPRYAGAFAEEPLPMDPSFNEADVSDKPAAIRNLPPLDADAIGDITRKYRCELGSLLAVDDGVRRIVHALATSGELGNTYVIFTSDNGFIHGQHRIAAGKLLPYEPSIRVPLIMRGPGIPRGVRVKDLVTNADLAPTLVRIADARARLRMDGRSLLPAAHHPHVERGRELSIEGSQYTGIRTARYVYIHYRDGEHELYDLGRDRYELHNRSESPTYATVRRHLAARLKRLGHCGGDTCRSRPRLAVDLDYDRARSARHPCASGPVGVRVGGRDRIRLIQARFNIDGRTAAIDRSTPFKVEVPRRRLDRGGTSSIGVLARLVDGREMTLRRHVRVCP
jgi:N-acetylglucosamine-6-sulfatase